MDLRRENPIDTSVQSGAVTRVSTYLRVANELASQIATLPPGHQLPSENELARMHGVSRLTARAAFQELERRFLITRMRARGSFVARRLEIVTRVGSSPSWSQAVREAGGVPENRVLRVVEEAPTESVRTELKLEVGEPALMVDRLCYVDGLIAEESRVWFRPGLAPHIDHLLGRGGSQVLLLESLGYHPQRRWIRADLTIVPEDVGRNLEFEGQPVVMHTTSTVEDALTGLPLVTGDSWMRPDVVQMTLELSK